MIFTRINQEQDGITDDKRALNCRFESDHTVIDRDLSIWKAMMIEFDDEFSPSKSVFTVVVTLDKMEDLVTSSEFDNFIMASIAFNTVFLAMEHYNASDAMITVQEAAGWVFNIIFISEMVIKIVCLKGFSNYITPLANRFDFVIVMSSITQIVVDIVMSAEEGDQLGILKLFRLFRALRVARLLRKFKSVRLILDAALGSMQPIINIMVFLFLMIVVFGCLGMQLYGNNMNFDDASIYGQESWFDDTGDDGLPRANFDDFLYSFYALFQVLTGSAWELVMFDCMRCYKNGGVVGFLYILVFFLVSNYIILNLFIGAILSNMGTDDDTDRTLETKRMRANQVATQERARQAQIFANSKFTDWSRGGCKGDLATMHEVMALDFAREAFAQSETPKERFGYKVDNNSMWYFGPYHPWRRFIYDLVKNPLFDVFILVIIIISTTLLALDNPSTREDQAWVDIFTICDNIFQLIFTVEFLFKCFAYGVIWTDNVEFMLADQDSLKGLVLGETGEPSYLYSGWNYLDLCVLIVGFINKFGDPDGPLKVLRLLRAFRPLRMINRIAGMKLVLGALVAACPALANVCILLLCVFLIFAILGLSLFAGKFS